MKSNSQQKSLSTSHVVKPSSGSSSFVNLPFDELRDLSSNSKQDPLLTDLHHLQDSFDSLFTSTLLFDIQSLAELICALAQLTVGVLGNFNCPSISVPG